MRSKTLLYYSALCFLWFTKTSNIWGVGNMSRGTNTNRIVLLRKPEGA